MKFSMARLLGFVTCCAIATVFGRFAFPWMLGRTYLGMLRGTCVFAGSGAIIGFGIGLLSQGLWRATLTGLIAAGGSFAILATLDLLQ